ncbi:DNA polymerase III subunit delta [Candidatus Saccharibacteria bacterium]|nr:DNA polymerase III subunit delta [Candidatus Saccharibacteria bacterium]
MIFYFYGENSYAISKQVAVIKNSYIKKTGGDADMEVFEMNERSLSDLLNALAVMPMFVSSRLLIVRELGTHKLQKDKLEALLASVSESTNVVFIDTNVDKRSVYYKMLSKLKNAKEFRLLSPHELLVWVKKLVDKTTNSTGSIDNRTINVLIQRVGNDEWQLEQEIIKLCNYSPEITIASIDELVVPNLQQTAFMMTDAITRKDTKTALELYARLAIDGVADQMILGAIVYQYRVMVLAKDNEGQGTAAWQKELSISPYAASKAQNLVRNTDTSELKRVYQLIIESDYAVKSGQKVSSDAMQELIFVLAQPNL